MSGSKTKVIEMNSTKSKGLYKNAKNAIVIKKSMLKLDSSLEKEDKPEMYGAGSTKNRKLVLRSSSEARDIQSAKKSNVTLTRASRGKNNIINFNSKTQMNLTRLRKRPEL